VVGFFFTLFIFTYLLGDNPLFRVTVYIFVGVAAGYVASVAWWQVLLPDLFLPLLTGSMTQRALLLVPVLLSLLVLMKVSPRLTNLGSPAMAFLVGVSAAVAIGGAVLGTILPQAAATIAAFDLTAAAGRGVSSLETLFNGAFILTGAVTTLAYFHFGARAAPDGSVRRFGPIELLAWVGRIFIGIALGVLFAGLYSAALAALIERLHSITTLLGFS
jgi:hypothetical protein